MPKHYRSCNFCTHNTTANPDLVIFNVSEELIKVLNVQSDTEIFICESHFNESDLKDHGNSKRLREGAIPVHFPRRDALNLDHNYVSTWPLDLVSKCISSSQKIENLTTVIKIMIHILLLNLAHTAF